MQTAEIVWKHCMELIKKKVDIQSFNTWFLPVIPSSFINNTLTIQVPTQFFYEWLEEHYVHVLKHAIDTVIGEGAKLEYSIIVDKGNATSKPITVNIPNKKSTPAPQENIRDNFKTHDIYFSSSNLQPSLTFDSFIEGDCNKFARAAGLQVSLKPGISSFNPMIVFGGVGLGKTHLAQAIGNKIRQLDADKIVYYIQSERFVQLFTDYMSNNSLKEFTDFFMLIDVLIIDDVQFFANKGKSQEMFFQIFNHLHQSNKQIIMTSDRAPKDLEGLMDRLISRFKWGLNADLQQPDLETKIAIVKSKMHTEGITIPEEVIEYIAVSVDTNIRELEGVLTSLIAHSTIIRKEINLELAKSILKNVVKEIDSDVGIDFIQKAVAESFKVSVEEMKDKTRKKEIVIARQTAMYFAKNYTNLSLKAIGYHFGKRDHTTVLHAIEAVNNMLDTDKAFKNQIADLQKRLKLSK
ncbi:MAG: chromosomal replication initiator protein DnaA [Cytophagales bacterium]